MTTTIFKISKINMLHVLISCLIIFSLGSCAKKIVFPVSTALPAASGSVSIKLDKNKNYAIALNVKHMAGPERLQPAKSNYVVWIETAEKGTINLGRVKISKSLTGSLKAITPFKPIVVFITAEEDPNIKFPGMQVVLKTNSFDL